MVNTVSCGVTRSLASASDNQKLRPTHSSSEVGSQMAEALLDNLPATGIRDVDLEAWVVVEFLDLLRVVPLHVPGDLNEVGLDVVVLRKVCAQASVRSSRGNKKETQHRATEIKNKLILWTRTPRVSVLFRRPSPRSRDSLSRWDSTIWERSMYGAVAANSLNLPVSSMSWTGSGSRASLAVSGHSTLVDDKSNCKVNSAYPDSLQRHI
eukprot:2180449-Rhodomonas_salina.1